MILSVKRDNQNALYPSTMLSNSRKARMPGRRPLDSRRTLKTPLSRNSLRIRCAVGVGMFFCDVNSDVSKTGRRKRKSSAWIAYSDRVDSVIAQRRRTLPACPGGRGKTVGRPSSAVPQRGTEGGRLPASRTQIHLNAKSQRLICAHQSFA